MDVYQESSFPRIAESRLNHAHKISAITKVMGRLVLLNKCIMAADPSRKWDGF